MSATLDPTKLKVVELRAELSSRGLDTKGNKPVLVKRLREALEAEDGKGKYIYLVFYNSLILVFSESTFKIIGHCLIN